MVLAVQTSLYKDGRPYIATYFSPSGEQTEDIPPQMVSILEWKPKKGL